MVPWISPAPGLSFRPSNGRILPRSSAPGVWAYARSPVTDVVPANAGTHTPRPLHFDSAGRRLSRNNKRLWLWVPAFAGTTIVGAGWRLFLRRLVLGSGVAFPGQALQLFILLAEAVGDARFVLFAGGGGSLLDQ